MSLETLPRKYIHDMKVDILRGVFQTMGVKGDPILDYKGKRVLLIDRFSTNFHAGQEVNFCTIAEGDDLMYGRELYDKFCFFDFSFDLSRLDESIEKALSFLEKIVLDSSINKEMYLTSDSRVSPFNVGQFNDFAALIQRYVNAADDTLKPTFRVNTASDSQYNGFFKFRAGIIAAEPYHLDVSCPLDPPLFTNKTWLTINQHSQDVYGWSIVGYNNKQLSLAIQDRLN